MKLLLKPRAGFRDETDIQSLRCPQFYFSLGRVNALVTVAGFRGANCLLE